MIRWQICCEGSIDFTWVIGRAAGSGFVWRCCPADSTDDDVRQIIPARMFLPRLLAAFYLGQSSAAGDEPASASRREELGPILAGWASEFFAAPNPASRAALLSALEFHAGRASTAKAEAKLIALVTQEVLEPLSHFDRGLARALIGDREGAQKESADAASRIRDPQARALLQQAVEKILGWEVTASTRR